jgi:hypothetical protein
MQPPFAAGPNLETRTNLRGNAPLVGRAEQTSLRESFEAGESAAHNNVVESGRVGQTELRNFDRGRFDRLGQKDPETAYEYQSEQDGTYGEILPSNADGHHQVRPVPTLNSPARPTGRTDGKRTEMMPVDTVDGGVLDYDKFGGI